MALAAALARRRIYYGWYIVGTVFLFSMVTSALSFYGAPVFLKEMTGDLGVSRGLFAAAMNLGTFISSFLALAVGPFMDRRGGRGLMLIGSFTVGLGAILLGLVQNWWQLLLVKGVLFPFGLAGIGQLAAQVIVPNWFIKKRGRALAITAIGTSAPGIIMPFLATYLISALGWRQAWIVLGLLAWAVALPPIALFIKRRPEDIGLLPDGEAATPLSRGGRPPLKPEVTWTRQETLRTPAFWLLTLSIPLGMMAWTVIAQHLYAFLTDVKFAPQTAAFMGTTMYSVAVGFKPVWGFIAERVPVRYCLAVVFSLLGLGMALLPWVEPSWAVLLLIMVFLGMFGSALMPLQGLIWANYYGRMSLGLVRGMGMPLQSLLSPAGPVLAGYVWDVTGSYRGIFTAYLGTQGLAALLMLMARPPKKKELAPSVMR